MDYLVLVRRRRNRELFPTQLGFTPPPDEPSTAAVLDSRPNLRRRVPADAYHVHNGLPPPDEPTPGIPLDSRPNRARPVLPGIHIIAVGIPPAEVEELPPGLVSDTSRAIYKKRPPHDTFWLPNRTIAELPDVVPVELPPGTGVLNWPGRFARRYNWPSYDVIVRHTDSVLVPEYRQFREAAAAWASGAYFGTAADALRNDAAFVTLNADSLTPSQGTLGLYNWSFALPYGAYVLGMAVTLRLRTPAAAPTGGYTATAAISRDATSNNGSVAVGSRSQVLSLTGSFADYQIGIPGDLWGLVPQYRVYHVFNSRDWGLRVQFSRADATAQVEVNYASLTVWYTFDVAAISRIGQATRREEEGIVGAASLDEVRTALGRLERAAVQHNRGRPDGLTLAGGQKRDEHLTQTSTQSPRKGEIRFGLIIPTKHDEQTGRWGYGFTLDDKPWAAIDVYPRPYGDRGGILLRPLTVGPGTPPVGRMIYCDVDGRIKIINSDGTITVLTP